MFSSAEKQVAYSSGGDKTQQELGSLGLSADDFKTILTTLKKRSECLFLSDPGRSLRPHITDRTTQNSLLSLLGSTKKKTDGNGSEIKKSSSKNNLKNKIEAEEAAIKNVFEIMASTLPSKDNPLKNHDIVISTNPWNAQSEKQLEYIFSEGVCLDADYRYLSGEDTGDSPFMLTVRFEIRILQCLLLNFVWFMNRLYKVMNKLDVESRASSTSIVYSDGLNNGWGDMVVKHCIKRDNVPAALEFLRTEYPIVYNKINETGKTPTYFTVNFEMVDNAIGLPNNDMEHQGTACVEWRCFNSIKKNTGEEFRTNNLRLGIDNVLFGGSSEETAAETEGSSSAVSSANDTAAAEMINFGVNIDNGKIFDSAVDNSSWMKSIMEVDEESTAEFTKFEKFRSGTSTATVNQSSAVSLVAMAKGNESVGLVHSLIKFIDDSVKAIDDPYMYSNDRVFPEDQGEIYEDHKDAFLAAICSNPPNIYNVVCHLFTNLLLPRLRNPVRDTRQISSQPLGKGRTKVMTEHGCGDMQYAAYQHAKGRARVSGRISCKCGKTCKESRCFDGSRLTNTLRNPDPVEKRHHNSHRSNAYDFRFFDKIENEVRQISNKKKTNEKECTMKYDFLAQDSKAFDLLSKCFPSASLHHIYCPDVLMVHRGNNFNIDLKNNKLDCTNQSEEITSSQTVNAKEALRDITSNKLRKGADIVEHFKTQGVSLREFSNETSRAVRNLNELTNKLCKFCNTVTDTLQIIKAILRYIIHVMPTLETILSFVDIEELQKPFHDLKACTSNEPIANKAIIKASFVLFKATIKFLHRNYNASVTAAINRRGYLTYTANMIGYRFQFVENVIRYHETTVIVSSSVAYADYFSSRSDTDDGNFNENGMTNIDKTVASLMGDFSDSDSFDSKKKNDEKTEMFVKMFAGELLGGDEDEDEEAPLPPEEKEEEDKEESILSQKSPQRMKRLLSGSDDENQDREKKRYKTDEEEERVF